MITYTEIKRYDKLDFSEYLKLGGSSFSHSFLKGENYGEKKEIVKTPKMVLGSLVDGILTEPAKVEFGHELYPAAKIIAARLKEKFGTILSKLTTQVSYTAVANYQGYRLPVTGRLDFLLEKIGVLDLKITGAKDLNGLIKFMGYENQTWNYNKLSETNQSWLMIYSTALKDAQIIPTTQPLHYNEFWANKILKFGTN